MTRQLKVINNPASPLRSLAVIEFEDGIGLSVLILWGFCGLFYGATAYCIGFVSQTCQSLLILLGVGDELGTIFGAMGIQFGADEFGGRISGCVLAQAAH